MMKKDNTNEMLIVQRRIKILLTKLVAKWKSFFDLRIASFLRLTLQSCSTRSSSILIFYCARNITVIRNERLVLSLTLKDYCKFSFIKLMM